jgi:hypothetical protein
MKGAFCMSKEKQERFHQILEKDLMEKEDMGDFYTGLSSEQKKELGLFGLFVLSESYASPRRIVKWLEAWEKP